MYLKPLRSALRGRWKRCRAFVFHYQVAKIQGWCCIWRPHWPVRCIKNSRIIYRLGGPVFLHYRLCAGIARTLLRRYWTVLLGRLAVNHAKFTLAISAGMAVLGAEYAMGSPTASRCHYRSRVLPFLSDRNDLWTIRSRVRWLVFRKAAGRNAGRDPCRRVI